jgi:uncharacterized damage-inducible protein DinB
MKVLDQSEYVGGLARMTRETDARAAVLVTPLSERQLRWRPPDGGWSIADVLEHLCIVYDSYAGVLGTLIDSPNARAAEDGGQWAPTLVGGMMVSSFRSDRKLPAPKLFRPPPEPRANVLDEFLARERELLGRIERAWHLELRKTKLASPISRLVRINLGDALGILVEHARRHLGQMERVRARVGFPVD